MSKKILVVDDSKFIVNNLKARLESEDYQVITANNGKEAVDVYNSQELDLIILDVNMPEMDGHEALKTIRKTELTKGIEPRKGIPIIMLTASKEDWMDSFTEGCNSYMLKPYDGKELLKKIEEQLQ